MHVPFARGSRLRDAYVVSMADSVSEELTPGRSGTSAAETEDVSLTEEMDEDSCMDEKKISVQIYSDTIKCSHPWGRQEGGRERAGGSCCS